MHPTSTRLYNHLRVFIRGLHSRVPPPSTSPSHGGPSSTTSRSQHALRAQLSRVPPLDASTCTSMLAPLETSLALLASVSRLTPGHLSTLPPSALLALAQLGRLDNGGGGNPAPLLPPPFFSRVADACAGVQGGCAVWSTPDLASLVVALRSGLGGAGPSSHSHSHPHTPHHLLTLPGMGALEQELSSRDLGCLPDALLAGAISALAASSKSPSLAAFGREVGRRAELVPTPPRPALATPRPLSLLSLDELILSIEPTTSSSSSYHALVELLRRSGMDIPALLNTTTQPLSTGAGAAIAVDPQGQPQQQQQRRQQQQQQQHQGERGWREHAYEGFERASGAAGAVAVAGLLLVVGRGFVGSGEGGRAPNKLISLLQSASPDALISLLRFSLVEVENALLTCSSSGGGGGAGGVGVGGSHLHARSTPGTLSSLNPSASASASSATEGSPHQRYSVLLTASLSALSHSGLDHFTTPQLASLAELLPLSGPQRALVPRKFWGVFVEEVRGRCARGEVVPSPHAHTLPPILRQHPQLHQQHQQQGGQGLHSHPHPLATDESIAWATDAVCLLHALSRMSPLAPPPTTNSPSTITTGIPLPASSPPSSTTTAPATATPASIARGILLDLVAHQPAGSSSTALSPLSLAAASSPAILEQLAYSVGMLYRSTTPGFTTTTASGSAGAGVPVSVLDAVGCAVLAARPESLSTEALWEVLLLFDKGGIVGGGGGENTHTSTTTAASAAAATAATAGAPSGGGVGREEGAAARAALDALCKTLSARSTREYHAMGLAGLLKLWSHASACGAGLAVAGGAGDGGGGDGGGGGKEKKKEGGLWGRIPPTHAAEIGRGILVRVREVGEGGMDVASLSAFLSASTALCAAAASAPGSTPGVGRVAGECADFAATRLCSKVEGAGRASLSHTTTTTTTTLKDDALVSSPLFLYRLLEACEALGRCDSASTATLVSGGGAEPGLLSATQGRVAWLLSQCLLSRQLGQQGGGGGKVFPAAAAAAGSLAHSTPLSHLTPSQLLTLWENTTAAQALLVGGVGGRGLLGAGGGPLVTPTALALSEGGGAQQLGQALGVLERRVADELGVRVKEGGGDLGGGEVAHRILRCIQRGATTLPL